jgi:hypothetical protein
MPDGNVRRGLLKPVELPYSEPARDGLHVQVGRLMRQTFFVPVWGTSSRKLRTLVRTPSWANGTKETRNVTCYLRSVCHPIATLNTGDCPGPPSPAQCLLRTA